MSDTPPAAPYAKFSFDTEFFEVMPGSDGLVPTVGNQQKAMEAVRQQAYADGFAAGLAEGQQQAQTDLAQLQQHTNNTLLTLQTTQAEREGQLLSQCLGLLHTTLHHLLGHAVTHYGPELLEHHLRSILPLLKTDESLTLRIHPAARGFHEKLGLPQAAILGLPMQIVPDTTLGHTDVIIEWRNGGVESKLAGHLAAVSALLAAAGASPVAAGTLQPDLTTPAPAAMPDAPAAPPPAAADTAEEPAISAAEQATRARAAELLGDDELVDALKT
ncbi:MAG: hypothetical protein WC829_22295 [Hyphomicrobium sp.]|jgi:flagellar biosynthesis/type III secretory pathway protein FliH